MKQSVRLGRVAGIPVGLHWSVLVMLGLIAEILAVNVLPTVIPHEGALVYWTVAAAGAVLFIAALAAHEIAHALVARHRGVAVRSITLWMLGGAAELEGLPPTPTADLEIALAGPVASFAASVLFGAVALLAHVVHGPGVVTAALTWLALMNIVLAVFNLLPGAPLDGGRILRGLLWKHYGDRQRASRAAQLSGQALGGILILIGLAELFAWRNIGGLWLMLIGWFLITMARAEQQTDEVESSLVGLHVRDVMVGNPEVGNARTDVSEFASRVVFSSRQTAFPVVSSDGDLVGVVFANTLAHVPPDDRATTRLGDIAVPVPAAYLAGPDTDANSLIKQPPLRGELLAAVLENRLITGLVTVDELRRAMLRSQLVTSTLIPAVG
ncbi:MAG: site-2 protease family protein [Streptosporangiaceae bacterium]|jgi:Zn-dependent protease